MMEDIMPYLCSTCHQVHDTGVICEKTIEGLESKELKELKGHVVNLIKRICELEQQ